MKVVGNLVALLMLVLMVVSYCKDVSEELSVVLILVLFDGF